ncbi:MAG TPA: glycosidase, partial [Candidatus Paceibacterota bacterium]|nr:glycosidase [Candidatus Paceibacterota bacterium]
RWDDVKVGIAAPPIETAEGWLLLYHGVSSPKNTYKLGAALLRLENPTEIIARTDHPILEPELPYERNGQVANVVFPCGAVVIEDKLYVYYGGADSVVGVATADLTELVTMVKDHSF